MDEGVKPAAVTAGQPAKHKAEQQRESDHRDGNAEGDAGAEEYARKHVATQGVGAEGMMQCRAEQAGRQVELSWVEGGEERRP